MGSDGIDRLSVADGKIDVVDLYVVRSIARPEGCAGKCRGGGAVTVKGIPPANKGAAAAMRRGAEAHERHVCGNIFLR